MPPTYLLARDHLQRASSILQGTDQRSLEIRVIIDRTIALIDDAPMAPVSRQDNVLDLCAYRRSRL